MKNIVVIVILGMVLGFMAFSNPSMDDYQNYVRQEILKGSKQASGPGGELSFGQMMGPLLGGLAGSLAASQTIRDDYVLFSIYELSFGKQRLRLLGVFKRFIVLETPK